MNYEPILFVGGPFHGTFLPVRTDQETVIRPLIPNITAFWITGGDPLEPDLTIHTCQYWRRRVGTVEVMVFIG